MSNTVFDQSGFVLSTFGLAYDMDMFTKNNNEVSSNLLKLAKKIMKLGIKVKVALWNGNGGKGLDDILVSDKCYIETINLVNEK